MVDNGLVSDVTQSSFSSEQNHMLTSVLGEEEIYRAFCSLNASSALGPDGFGGGFDKALWDIIRWDLIAQSSFFTTSSMPNNFNTIHVYLIPKTNNSDKIDSFMPITLAYFHFKIITKMLAEILIPIASKLVSPQCATFIKGRHISDCIITTSECINTMDQKAYGGNLVVKLDVIKAFDTLDWFGFLMVLETFDFDDTFIG